MTLVEKIKGYIDIFIKNPWYYNYISKMEYPYEEETCNYAVHNDGKFTRPGFCKFIVLDYVIDDKSTIADCMREEGVFTDPIFAYNNKNNKDYYIVELRVRLEDEKRFIHCMNKVYNRVLLKGAVRYAELCKCYIWPTAKNVNDAIDIFKKED